MVSYHRDNNKNISRALNMAGGTEKLLVMKAVATIIHKNNGTNGKICAEVAFPRYTESVKFKSQSRETASKMKTIPRTGH